MTEAIKQAFKRSGMTRFALAKRSGVHYQTIHGFFTPEGREITISNVERICDALGLRLVSNRRKQR